MGRQQHVEALPLERCLEERSEGLVVVGDDDDGSVRRVEWWQRGGDGPRLTEPTLRRA
jgi:hypothetical protein